MSTFDSVHRWRNRKPTMYELRKEIVGDSRTMEKLLARYVAMVREDEREKTIANLNTVKDRADR